jgi:hypothetical protein
MTPKNHLFSGQPFTKPGELPQSGTHASDGALAVGSAAAAPSAGSVAGVVVAEGLLDVKTSSERTMTTNTDKELFVSNNDECVLLRILPGKPNRKAAEPKRVTQPAQKGPTCFYYAMKVSALLEEDYLKRQKEADRKAASRYRKKWSELNYYQELKEWLVDFIVPKESDALTAAMLGVGRGLNKKAQVILVARQMLLMGSQSTGEGAPTRLFLEQANVFINRFEKSKEQDVLKFVSIALKQDQVKADLSFLSDLKLNVNDECLNHAAKLNAKWALFSSEVPYSKGDNVYAMPLDDQHSLLHKTAIQFLYKIFDLKPIDWSPLDNIDVLFNIIRVQKSPIEFSGFYGILAYNQPRVQANDNFEGYSVEGWPKGSHKGKDLVQGSAFEGTHAISVIGVKKNKANEKGQGYVYFLDPRIPSEPNALRVVLKMSYEQFCDYCIDDLALNLLVNNNLEKSCSVPDGEWRGVLDYGHQRQRFALTPVPPVSALATAGSAMVSASVPVPALPSVPSSNTSKKDEWCVDIVANPTPTKDSLVAVRILPIVPAYNAHAQATSSASGPAAKAADSEKPNPSSLANPSNSSNPSGKVKLTREAFNRFVEVGRQKNLLKVKTKIKG